MRSTGRFRSTSCACCKVSRPAACCGPRASWAARLRAGPTRRTIEKAHTYGEKLGLAFQIQDDLLDIEGDAAVLGKTTGKDARDEKSTFPSLLGVEECRRLAGELTEQAVAAVADMEGSGFLTGLARSLMGRSK